MLRAGPITLDEALPIAKHIAEGLEAAHGGGRFYREALFKSIDRIPR